MRKYDAEMSKRLQEELFKLADNVPETALKIGCNPQSVYNWLNLGALPSSYYFHSFHRAGMDVMYIITGERGTNTHV